MRAQNDDVTLVDLKQRALVTRGRFDVAMIRVQLADVV